MSIVREGGKKNNFFIEKNNLILIIWDSNKKINISFKLGKKINASQHLGKGTQNTVTFLKRQLNPYFITSSVNFNIKHIYNLLTLTPSKWV